MAKLVVAIVFIIVGIGAMIYRFTKRVFDKTNMIKMFKKAKESGLYASQICENLDLPYYSLPYDVLKLEKLNVSEQDWIIGNYRIIDLISLGDKILFLVECNFNDIDIA